MFRSKVFSIFLLFALLLSACSSDNNKIKWRVISLSGLNIRTSPNKTSRILSELQFNTEVELLEKSTMKEIIHGKEGQWVKIKYDNIIGWVFSPFLKDRNFTPLYHLKNRIQIAKSLSQAHEDRLPERLYKLHEKYGEGNYFKVIFMTEKILLKRDSLFAQRTNNTLYLKTDKGWVTKKNITNKKIHNVSFFYQGLYPDAKIYFLIDGFYEGKAVSLLNQATGSEISNIMHGHFRVTETPSFSPNRKFMLLLGINGLYRTGAGEICIVILEAKNKNWEKVFVKNISVDPLSYEIPVWLENDTVRLISIRQNEDSKEINVIQNNIIVLEGNKWVLRKIQ